LKNQEIRERDLRYPEHGFDPSGSLRGHLRGMVRWQLVSEHGRVLWRRASRPVDKFLGQEASLDGGRPPDQLPFLLELKIQ